MNSSCEWCGETNSPPLDKGMADVDLNAALEQTQAELAELKQKLEERRIKHLNWGRAYRARYPERVIASRQKYRASKSQVNVNKVRADYRAQAELARATRSAEDAPRLQTNDEDGPDGADGTVH